jgi:NADH-quinone oxidoreductase subunit H
MRTRSIRSLVVMLTTLLALLASVGCSRNDSANLVSVIDVVPRDVEVGDTIEVLGMRLPSGNVKRVKVQFSGQLHRPGKAPVRVQCPGKSCIEAEGQPSPDKVSLRFTEGLQRKFCGQGEQADHTTFRGHVTVIFPGRLQGGGKVQGRVMGVTIDFRPPSARRIVMQARLEQGQKALTYLGITAAGDDDLSGLRVQAVKAASAADRAGLLPNDLIVSFQGVTINGVADFIPRSGETTASIGLKRGNAEVSMQQISIAGFKSSGMPGEILAALITLGAAAFILLIFMAPTAGIITWVERRVSARMQSRVGPNRAGPQGFLIWIADGVKSIVKEDIIPTDSDEALFRLAPYLVFIGVSATFVVMPFGQHLIAADLDIGILFVIAVTSLVAIGLMTGGWASNNKWSLLGGIRAAAQVISYEIPAAVSVVCVVMMTGSLRMQDIIAAQGGLGESFMAAGGWPWHWYIFRNPVTFLLFFLFFTTALAEGNRAPFDLPEAESELVAGYSTEYSGMRYLFFFFAEWANVFVFCGIATALFLGGWQVPGVTALDQEASLGLQLLGVFLFLLKSWVLIFIVIWIRWTLPRVRIDQLMNLCWKWFVPMSFAAFLLTALWVMGTSPGVVMKGLPVASAPLIPTIAQHALGVVMFVVGCALVVVFAKRVHFNFKQSKQPLHLNPFI